MLVGVKRLIIRAYVDIAFSYSKRLKKQLHEVLCGTLCIPERIFTLQYKNCH